MDNDERPSIVLWNYIFDKCKCQYIKSERAYSAFITLCGYDYQEYELDEHAAKVKLAERLHLVPHILEWFISKQSK